MMSRSSCYRPAYRTWDRKSALADPQYHMKLCAHDPTLATPVAHGELTIYRHCPIFARKFGHPTTEAVHTLLEDLFII